MSSRHAVAFVLLMISFAGGASAGGVISAGPLVVVLDNGHESWCAERVTGTCLVEVTGEGGDMILHTGQYFRRIALVLDRDQVNDALRMPLLPDGRLSIDTADFSMDHGVFILLGDVIGERPLPGPEGATLFVNRTGVGLAYESPFGPNDENSTRRTAGIDFAEDAGFGYERLGPFDVYANSSTDKRLDEIGHLPCDVPPHDPACESPTRPVSEELKARLPMIVYGAGLRTAIVGSDLDALDAGGRPHYQENPTGWTRPGTPATGGTLPPPPSSTIQLPRPDPQPTLRDAPLTPSASHTLPRSGTPTSERTPDAAPHAPSPLLPLAASVILAIFAAALYSRLGRREQALAHPTRLRILALIQHEPKTLTDLARELGVDPTTALYHARLLEKTEHVVLRGSGRFTYVCTPGRAAPDAPPSAAERVGEELLQILADAGGSLPRHELHARAARIPAWARNEAIRLLTRAGRIARTIQGDTEILRVAPN